MQFSSSLQIKQQLWVPMAQKYLWLPEKKIILLSDLHLGKSAYFRANGFPLRIESQQDDFYRLALIDAKHQDCQIFILGDLFHSRSKTDFGNLSNIIQASKNSWIFIKGNHDVFEDLDYYQLGFSQVLTQYLMDDICLVHESTSTLLKSHFCVSGHLHPGYRIAGKAKQGITLPCFYFSDTHIILPAFGSLTGLKNIFHQKKFDTIMVCNEQDIYTVSNPKLNMKSKM